MLMRHILICGSLGPKTYLHVTFREKVYEDEMWVYIFYTTFTWKASYSKKNRGKIWSKVYIGLHVKWPLFLPDFNENLLSSTNFRNMLKYRIS
jgi:hypothetical protein